MSFKKDKARGKLGESLVKRYFIQEGCEVQDTSEDWLFQIDDVDLVVADSLKYEIKTDYRFHETGNFALEDSVIDAYGKSKSWLWKSKADRFAFVDAHNQSEFYVIDADVLRALVQICELKPAHHDDEYKMVNLFLLPLHEYMDLFEVCELKEV